MDPIVVEFEVAASLDHAFDMWTNRAAMWWPREHTMSRDPDLEVVFEPREGGRIFERATDGSEHPWGEVTVWNPPNRVDYWWHLFFDRSEATNVSVVFKEVEAGTRVRLEQVGFEVLAEPVGLERRNETDRAWNAVVEFYQEAF